MDINEQYLGLFIDESKENIQNCNTQLLELENDTENLEIVHNIFRSAHTLKGMAATMGFEDLTNLTHQMENVLDAIRNHKLSITTDIMDVLFESMDNLEEMIVDISEGGTGKKDVRDLVQKLASAEKGESIAPVATPDITKDTPKVSDSSESREALKTQYNDYDQTVLEQAKREGFSNFEIQIGLAKTCVLKAARVYMIVEALEKIGEIIKTEPVMQELEAENFAFDFTIAFITKESADMVSKTLSRISELEVVNVNAITEESYIKAPTAPKTKEPEKVAEVLKPLEKTVKNEKPAPATNDKQPTKGKAVSNKTIRVNIDRLDLLMNLFEELIVDRGRLEQIAKDRGDMELSETVSKFTRVSEDLQNVILNIRMVPVETVFNRFPRMVRQLAKDLKKKIHLEVLGAETELDRTVVDEIGDPLVHLLRNAIDHGVESAEERIAKGKPEEGTIVLKAFHSGNHVIIEIEDDGAGINKEKVLQKAISRGIVTKEEGAQLTDRQINELLFASGFSTADVISDISGRGVGLDVVKTTIESLNGSITIDSTEGKGTKFSVQLPFTLSIISVMLVKLKEEIFAIPISSIVEVTNIHKDQIMNAHNQRMINFRGSVVPLIDLRSTFNVPGGEEESEYTSVVLIKKGDKVAAICIDTYIGQQDVVLKTLGDYLTSVFAISGATILGDGTVALIVDCNALIE